LICLIAVRYMLSKFSIIIAERPEEGWVMSQINLHFDLRLLIVGIALIYVLIPMLWNWQNALPISHDPQEKI
jgi:hypothetical protein